VASSQCFFKTSLPVKKHSAKLSACQQARYASAFECFSKNGRTPPLFPQDHCAIATGKMWTGSVLLSAPVGNFNGALTCMIQSVAQDFGLRLRDGL